MKYFDIPLQPEQNTKKSKKKIISITVIAILIPCLLLGALAVLSQSKKYVSINVGSDIVIAVRKNGKIVADGDNSDLIDDIKKWDNIISVAIGHDYVVAAQKDGSVLYEGARYNNLSDVEKWDDIISVSACQLYIVGLKKDGTVVHLCLDITPSGYDPDKIDDIVNDYSYDDDNKSTNKHQSTGCNLCEATKKWKNIVSVSVGPNYILGVKKDGSVVTSGYIENNVFSGWKNIASVSSCAGYSVGLKKDGTVITSCTDEKIKKEIESWHDVVYVSCGTNKHDYWNLSRSECYTVGIKEDGEIVCTGTNSELCSEIEDW